MTTVPRLPHVSTPRTRALGCSSLLFALISPLLLLLEPDMPRPRWDVIATEAVALALGFGWLFVSATAPALGRIGPPADAVLPPPGVPTQIPRPRGRWLVSAAMALGVTLAFALLQTFLFDVGPQYQHISELRRAGAVVMDGRVTGTPDLEVIRESNAQGHTTSVKYRGDLRLAVDNGHGGAVVITLPGSTLDHETNAGDVLKILAVPGRPELGGYVDGSANLDRYLRWETPYSWPAALLPLAVLFVLMFRRGEYADFDFSRINVVRKDARDGEVPAVRVVLEAAVREEKIVPGSRPGTAEVEARRYLQLTRQGNQGKGTAEMIMLPGAYPPVVIAQLGQAPGWLVAARRWQLIKGGSPLAFVSDDGFCVWGEFDYHTSFEYFFGINDSMADGRVPDGRVPEDRVPEDSAPPNAELSPRPAIRLLPRPSWGAYSIHLLPMLLGGLAFALTLPILLDAPPMDPSDLLPFLSAPAGLAAVVLGARRLSAARVALPWQVRKAP